MKSAYSIFFACLISIGSSLFAQDSLLTKLAIQNHKELTVNDNGFEGDGWDFLKEKTVSSKNVLIGEDHFTNEIPKFIRALSEVTTFENFYIEVDPYSTRIIERSLKEYTDTERMDFNAEYGDLLSFYSLEPEYELLKHLSDKGANVLGSDQVIMYADLLICQDLMSKTNNNKAKEIYSKIVEKSRAEMKRFYEETKDFMTIYFMTPEFTEDLNRLSELNISDEEKQIVEDMKRSVSIYVNQSHKSRVNLILNQLMKDYPEWKDSKNLFKYGANHMTRGETFLQVYDVGNMVANITESNYEESFHIMIVGKSGMVGSVLKNFPPKPVDIENDFFLSYLKPFFDLSEGDNWHLFDLVPLRKMIRRGKLKIDNQNLVRAIKGYDALVIIPEVTPAEFLNQSDSK